jgi:polyisoprenoid-binding protein YceI
VPASEWSGTCQADFAVSVTMDSFVGHVATEPFAIADGSMPAQVDVQITKMDTGKKGRNEEMYKMFGADKNPVIHASATSAAMLSLSANATNELPIQLTIAGQTNEVKATLTNFKEADGKRTFDAAFPVSVKSFGLKAPSMMLGAISVHDVVKITAHVSLDSKATTKP